MQLTMRQAADVLKVSRQTIWNYIQAGELTAERVPHGKQLRWMVESSEIERFQAAQAEAKAAALADQQ